jgi:hypothetical protein
MTDIKVGSVVTWRSGGAERRKGHLSHLPMGIAGCKVLELFEQNGERLALLRHPLLKRGEKICAYQDDLET